MSFKLFSIIGIVYISCFLLDVESSFIKGKNIPRVGRSDESEGMYDQGSMGYVIKTIPSKNIPRMGRRNYDSQNRFDIPKLMIQPENMDYGDADPASYSQEQSRFYGNEMENMKK